MNNVARKALGGACAPVALAILLVCVGSVSVACKKEKTEPVLEAPIVAVSTPALNAVAPPVATIDQAQGNPSSMPTVTVPVETVGVGNKNAPGKPGVLDKASEAALDGRSADVRRLLEAKVRAGHGSPDEVRLVRRACSSPFDKACIDDIKAKYP
jgi:hypothetical protein